jgi:putative transposase
MLELNFARNLDGRNTRWTSTPHPDRAWIAQQARNLSMHFAEQPEQPTLLLRDHDGKFSEEFDSILAADGIEVKPVGPMAPNLTAYAERWVQSVKCECLDHFVFFGEPHLRFVLREYQEYYNGLRPHQSLANTPPAGSTSPLPAPLALGDIACDERMGGLL